MELVQYMTMLAKNYRHFKNHTKKLKFKNAPNELINRALSQENFAKNEYKDAKFRLRDKLEKRKLKMRIYNKDSYGFWIFKCYYFYLENDDTGALKEMNVDKKTWDKFDVGDYLDAHYMQFFKYNNRKLK